jgi:hypothetical protein
MFRSFFPSSCYCIFHWYLRESLQPHFL